MKQPDQFPCLPALRNLGGLADVRPTVIIDSREQTPLVFTLLPSLRGTLQSGDYSFCGGEELFAVERKSIQDLVSCCSGPNRERFERELHRLRGFRFKRLLVTGHEVEVKTGRYRGGISPRAVLSTVSAFEVRYDVPVVWAGTPDEAARIVERWVWWCAREMVEVSNSLLRGSATAAEFSAIPVPEQTGCADVSRPRCSRMVWDQGDEAAAVCSSTPPPTLAQQQ